MPFEIILVVVVVAAAAVLLGRGLLRNRATRVKQTAQLAELDFVPCAEDTEHLQTLVRRLRGSPNVEVHSVHRRGSGDGAVYWYHVHVPDGDAPIDAEEFLFACESFSAQRFALFLQSVSLPEGLVKRVLESILAKVSSLAPSGVEPIEIPPQLRSKLLTALGPSGKSLYDLIDDQHLTLLMSSASRGFFAIRVAEGYCAMELLSAYGRNALPDFDWTRAASASLETAARLA